MSNTFRVGDMTIHRIVEMECGFTPALEFLPDLKSEVLEENKSWLAPVGAGRGRTTWCCASSPTS